MVHLSTADKARTNPMVPSGKTCRVMKGVS
jgi:hypothetical protein